MYNKSIYDDELAPLPYWYLMLHYPEKYNLTFKFNLKIYNGQYNSIQYILIIFILGIIFILFGFSFTNIDDLQDGRERGRLFL